MNVINTLLQPINTNEFHAKIIISWPSVELGASNLIQGIDGSARKPALLKDHSGKSLKNSTDTMRVKNAQKHATTQQNCAQNCVQPKKISQLEKISTNRVPRSPSFCLSVQVTDCTVE